MGKWFNENLMRAKAWPRRGRGDLRRELMERRLAKTEETLEIASETVALKPTKDTGGRPKLDIPLPEVLRMLSEGESKSFIARELGVSRRSIDRAIEDSPTARKIWGMRKGNLLNHGLTELVGGSVGGKP